MKNEEKVLVLLTGVVALSLMGCQPTANEPCERCGDSPSVVYAFDNGDTGYVCKDCGDQCDFCDGSVDTIYLNGFGKVMFACKSS